MRQRLAEDFSTYKQYQRQLASFAIVITIWHFHLECGFENFDTDEVSSVAITNSICKYFEGGLQIPLPYHFPVSLYLAAALPYLQ
jgi:hypothetical protein